jgi:hypothetical protein
MGNADERAVLPIHWLSLNGAMSALIVLGGIGTLVGVPLLALVLPLLLGAMAIGAVGGLALYLYRR